MNAILARLCILLCIASSLNAIITVDTNTLNLVDEYGRTRIFHGVNAVFKAPPWHPKVDAFDPQSSISAEDITNLKLWGFNAIRLGMMWPGVNPTKGEINQTYIEIMKKLVDDLGAQGIYTIVDFHQDLFNRKFCGEGAPDWATVNSFLSIPFPLPVADTYKVDPQTGYPSLADCLQYDFAVYYFSDKVGNAFQSLYDNVDGIQDNFASFWDTVSQAFNSTDTVLGYELINEPWPGDIYLKPDLLAPGIADKTNLKPLYENLNMVIRNNDQKHIVFFERSLVDIVSESGFTSGPGGPTYNDRQVFSYHIYCGPTDREGDPRNIVECDLEDEVMYDLSMADVKRLGVGGFMTEFGAMTNATVAIESIEFLTSAADKRLQSWTYWQFKYFSDLTTSGNGESFYDGDQLEETKVKALSRTYAQAIAGVPTSMTFDSQTGTFQLIFILDLNIKASTEIFLNQNYYYPNGFSIVISPSGVANWSQVSQNYLSIDPTPSAQNGQAVSVTIKAK